MRTQSTLQSSSGSTAPHDEIVDYITQMYERLGTLSAESLRQGQPLLQASLTELSLSLEELIVAEEELRAQNEQLTEFNAAITHERQRYQDLFDAAPDAYLVTDTAGVIQEANRTAEALLCLTRRFLVGKPLAVFVPKEDRTGFRRALQQVGQPEQAEEWEIKITSRRGPEVTVGARVTSMPNGSGQAASLRWIIRDLSSRLGAEAGRFRVMVDAIPHIAWTTRTDGGADYYNRRWYEYSGLTTEETQNRGWEAVIHPDDLEHTHGIRKAAEEAGAASEVEYRLKRADGAYRWHLGRTEPLRDGAGRLVGWVGTTTDITERKEAEQAQAALLEHDHTIATQLQAALQPDLPEVTPGLVLASHYEAALAEAGVGGDFFDVFTFAEGCIALVVGDLSGKGLAAAAQVATVRNMLRALLYAKPRLTEAVSDLNQILATNGLLDGFATLFVGTYEPTTGLLKYVNCGQEPALIRRAETRDVEALPPTGMILGTIAEARYTEAEVCLRPGDALAIFTDGLTESGPSYREMLGFDGLTALVRQLPPPDGAAGPEQMAAHLAQQLIAGVNKYAQSTVRDDVCLLVGVVR